MNPPIIADQASDTMLSDYNRIAIENAAKLHDFRTSLPQRSDRAERADLPIEELVPAFNTTASGVFREYERMGERPVSAGLEQRAASQGVEFEHLGLTLGTVLHHVDLTTTPSPELIQLIRDTLLERKVIFFRDQHLEGPCRSIERQDQIRASSHPWRRTRQSGESRWRRDGRLRSRFLQIPWPSEGLCRCSPRGWSALLSLTDSAIT